MLTASRTNGADSVETVTEISKRSRNVLTNFL
ncbi:Uncharacterised protein [Vibrio cholerae]|nr:Uncharacterised protein [Vibrio cholerae]